MKKNNNKREFEQNDEMEEAVSPTNFSQKRVSKVSLKNFYNGVAFNKSDKNVLIMINLIYQCSWVTRCLVNEL